MDTFCQSPVTINTQINNANIPNERQISSDILAETLKGFKILTLHSTINDSTYYNLEKYDAESNPKNDPLVATHTSDGKKRKVTDTDTTNRIFPQKLLINRTIPVIISPIDPPIADEVAASRGTLHARQKIASKEIVTDAVRSGAHVFRYPVVINWKDTDRMIPRDKNTSRSPPILTTPVQIGGGPSISPIRIGSQEISSTSVHIGLVEVRNAQPFHTSIN